jgi:hypothetical protein
MVNVLMIVIRVAVTRGVTRGNPLKHKLILLDFSTFNTVFLCLTLL